MIRPDEDLARHDIDSTSTTSSIAMDNGAATFSLSQTITKQRRGILSIKKAHAIFDWIFFALLNICFGLTLYCQYMQQYDEKQNSPPRISLTWIIFNFLTIAVFCIIAVTYRNFYRCGPTIVSLLLFLLPDIFANIVLHIVLVAGIFIGFVALVALTVVLSIMLFIGFYHQRVSGLHSIVDPTGYKRLTDPEDDDNDDEAIDADNHYHDDDDVWLF